MGVFEQFPYTNFHDLNTDWILKLIKELDAKVDSMEEWKAQHEAEYKELKRYIDELRNGELTPAMYDAIKNWCDKNLPDLIGSMIKFITVSINSSGYFVLTYPEHWTDIKFNTTGLDIETPLQPDYGHLTISY